MEAFCTKQKGVIFRRRLSGVVFKPPYAADTGNGFVVSDKEKRKPRFLQVRITELNASEPMMKPRKAIYDVESRLVTFVPASKV